MATTTPDGIYYPTSTTQISPLETQFSTLATSVQTALTNRKTLTVATATALAALLPATYTGYVVNVSGNGSAWYSNGTKWILVDVPVVADGTARDALYVSPVTPTQGDTVFRNDLGYATTYYALYNVSTNPGGRPTAGWFRELVPSGSILNVTQSTFNTTLTTTNTATWDDTGLTVTITPSSSSSRFLLFATLGTGHSATAWNYFQFVRNGTAIGVGTGATLSNSNVGALIYITDNSRFEQVNFSFLDAPATASAVTYKVQWHTYSGTGYLNRRGADATGFRGRCSLNVLEIA